MPLASPKDGSIGPETLAAAGNADPATLIGQLSNARMAFYHELPSFDHFGGGWTARVQRVTALATQLAAPVALADF